MECAQRWGSLHRRSLRRIRGSGFSEGRGGALRQAWMAGAAVQAAEILVPEREAGYGPQGHARTVQASAPTVQIKDATAVPLGTPRRRALTRVPPASADWHGA
eukprot:6825778-Pyramimonas_sp.AAC.1